jgi:hypothetical protein
MREQKFDDSCFASSICPPYYCLFFKMYSKFNKNMRTSNINLIYHRSKIYEPYVGLETGLHSIHLRPILVPIINKQIK